MAKYRVEHEFDFEPTYIVDADDEPVLTLEPDRLSSELRKQMADIFCDMLNREGFFTTVDQVVAGCETMLTHYGNHMPAWDYTQRSELCRSLRKTLTECESTK